MIREREVKAATGLGRMQRWRLMRAGTFPAAVKISDRAIAWYADEVAAWAAQRPRARYGAATLGETNAADRGVKPLDENRHAAE
jgi:prophage regulatory protein